MGKFDILLNIHLRVLPSIASFYFFQDSLTLSSPFLCPLGVFG